MREILFRGKRLDNGEWVEGYLCKTVKHLETCHQNVVVDCIEVYDGGSYLNIVFRNVDPTTVGQYTGLTDIGGKRLFEHDVVTAKFKNNGARYNFKVIYKDGGYMFHNGSVAVRFDQIRSARKIGNIHDNPEMLEAET